MSTTIPNAHVIAFQSSVLYTAQQRGSKLNGTIMPSDGPVVGKSTNVERIGRVEMQQKTGRHADVAYISTPHTRRRLDIKDWQVADLIDDPDKVKVRINAETAYSTTFGMAAGRTIDREILAAMNGNAIDGDGALVAFDAGNEASLDLGGAGANFTFADIASIRSRMILNGTDDSEEFHAAIGGAALNDLLQLTQVGSADFVAVQALITGTIRFWMGFNWHVLQDNLLPLVPASTDRWAFFYTTMGGEKGDQINPNVRVERIAQKDSTQVLLTSSFGVVRTDEARVARFRHAVP
jgi:hypothetical protein